MFELVFAAAVSASSADLSPNAQALVTSIAASIEQVQTHQAALPPPKDDAERILRLGELDQAPREVIVHWDFSKIPEAERARALERASALIEAVDREDQAALLKLVPPEGWFLRHDLCGLQSEVLRRLAAVSSDEAAPAARNEAGLTLSAPYRLGRFPGAGAAPGS